MPKTKKITVEDEMLTIPTFLNRTINPDKVAVGYTNVDGKLYKVDSEGNLFDAHTNKLKRGKKNG
jgi:hypothetical protein